MVSRPHPLAGLWRWVVLEGNRLVVTAGFLVAVFLLLGPVGHLLTGRGLALFGPSHDPTRLLSTLLSGVFLLVSIVVSINSLYISQEQAPLGQQHEQVSEVGRFREEIEEVVDEPVSQAEPSRLLRLLTGSIVTRLQSLGNSINDASVQANVDDYLRATADRTGRVGERLGSATGYLDLVLATVDYEYGQQANGLRRLRSDHGDELPPEATETIDSLLDTLEHFATAREYVKTLYFRREFATLSTHLLSVSLVAILVVLFTIVHAGSLPTTHVFVTAVQTVALAPFVLLASYVFRAAAVVRRTSADGQFALDSE